MARERAWPSELRAEALRVYLESGLRAASWATGVPRATIAYWARADGVLIVDPADAQRITPMLEANEERIRIMRSALRERLLVTAHDLIERMDVPHVEFVGKDGREVLYPIAPPSAVKDYAVAAGILIDKFRLESGEASAVVGSVEVLPRLNDHEKAALAEVLRAAIREKAEAPEPVAT